MVRRCSGAGLQSGVSNIGDIIASAAETVSTIHVPHRHGDVTAYEGLSVGQLWWDKKVEAGGVLQVDLDAHVRAIEVEHEMEDLAKGRVCQE